MQRCSSWPGGGAPRKAPALGVSRAAGGWGLSSARPPFFLGWGLCRGLGVLRGRCGGSRSLWAQAPELSTARGVAGCRGRGRSVEWRPSWAPASDKREEALQSPAQVFTSSFSGSGMGKGLWPKSPGVTPSLLYPATLTILAGIWEGGSAGRGKTSPPAGSAGMAGIVDIELQRWSRGWGPHSDPDTWCARPKISGDVLNPEIRDA